MRERSAALSPTRADDPEVIVLDYDDEHDFLPFRALFGADPDSLSRLREIEDQFPKPWHPVVHDYYPQRRSMERVTVAGEPPLGVADETL
ncbi:MAG: hypothetical protein P8N02_16730, partial [Actinomycetota bacterium]|nr:hypothetical protein [Actinomycetota bacterium]